jgi:hypothetical protein
LATKWTGDAAVVLPELETVAVAGEETYTPAKAVGMKNVKSIVTEKNFLAHM